ncbi:alpha/beta hydrolase [Streptomyces tricolor]|nr:alpha/beta hydrolase [Streptomyces tricolor]
MLVLAHGLGFDGSVWAEVVAGLRSDFRVLVPVLPIGSHRRPMRPDADLSAHGIARLLAEFMDRLDLRDVTLVQNDTGTAQLLVGVRDERIARLVPHLLRGAGQLPAPESRAASSPWRARSPAGSSSSCSPSASRSWPAWSPCSAAWRSGGCRRK